jgi:uncharacterized protein (TIGR02145 family)
MLKKIKEIGRKALLYTTLALPIFFSCEDESIKPESPEVQKEITLSDKAIILDKDELNNISRISSDTISFSNASDYKIGDLLIGGISEKTPKGLLKKIKDIDGNFLLTENASLENVITYGNIHFSRELTQEDLLDSSLKSSNENYNFCKLIDEIVYDQDGDLSTENDQIRATGKFEFNANITADASFDNGFKNGYVKTTIDGALDLNIGTKIHEEIHESIELIQLNFTPFTIPGTPPIVMTPKIEANIGIDANVDGEASLDIYGRAYLMGKINFQKSNGWSFKINKDLHFDAKPKIELNANMKAYLKSRATLTTNGILGAFAEIEEYIRADADINENPGFTIYQGVDFSMGANAGLFSSFIPEYNENLIHEENILLQSKLFEKPKATLESNLTNGEAPFIVNFDASKSSSGKPIKEYHFIFGDGHEYFETDKYNDGIFDGKASHTYGAGKFKAKIIIKDEIGRYDESTLEIIAKDPNIFIDTRDNQEYRTVKIGDQIWFSENFNYTTKDSYYYKNDSVKNHKYGRLYTRSDAQINCPPGWRIPSSSDWGKLLESLGETQYYTQDGIGYEITARGLKDRGFLTDFGENSNIDDCFWISSLFRTANPPYKHFKTARIIENGNPKIINVFIDNDYDISFFARPMKDAK